MWRVFGMKNHSRVPAAKILIASLSDVFSKEEDADSFVYRQHYRPTEAILRDKSSL